VNQENKPEMIKKPEMPALTLWMFCGLAELLLGIIPLGFLFLLSPLGVPVTKAIYIGGILCVTISLCFGVLLTNYRITKVI
jgi:hypothetical protein